MADLLTLNPANTAELKISHGGVDYILNTKGELFDLANNQVKGSKQIGAISTAIAQFEQNPEKLSAEVKTAFGNIVEKLPVEPQISGRLTKLKQAFAIAKEVEADAALTLDGAVKKLAGNKAAVGLLSEEAQAKVYAFDGFAEALAKADAHIESLAGAKKALAAELAKDAPNVEAVKKLLINNVEHETDLLATIKPQDFTKLRKLDPKFSAKGIIDEAKSQIAMGMQEAQRTGAAIRDTNEIIKSYEAVGTNIDEAGKEALEAAKKSKGELESAFKKATSGDYGHKVAERLEADHGELFKEIGEASKDMESHLKGAVKNAKSSTASVATDAAKGRGFVAKLLHKSEKDLLALAEKEGKAVADLGAFQKLSKLKGAGWVAGVVTAAYMAGIGRNPEQSKFTEAEMQRSQGVDPAMAR